MKISIITVCKNAQDALPRTMDSVLSQTYPDIEHIVIDGASTDGTVAFLQEHERKRSFSHDARLTTHEFRWISEPDSGIYQAMNRGISLARGHYLLFLNAGDTFHDERVIEDVFSQEPAEDILYGDVLWVDERKQIRQGHSFAGYSLNEAFFVEGSLAHPATFIRSDLFKRHGYYNESYSIVADWEFWIRAILCGKCSVRYVPRIISDYRLDGISADPCMASLHKTERCRVIRKYFTGAAVRFLLLKSWAEGKGVVCLPWILEQTKKCWGKIWPLRYGLRKDSCSGMTR